MYVCNAFVASYGNGAQQMTETLNTWHGTDSLMVTLNPQMEAGHGYLGSPSGTGLALNNSSDEQV